MVFGDWGCGHGIWSHKKIKKNNNKKKLLQSTLKLQQYFLISWGTISLTLVYYKKTLAISKVGQKSGKLQGYGCSFTIGWWPIYCRIESIFFFSISKIQKQHDQLEISCHEILKKRLWWIHHFITQYIFYPQKHFYFKSNLYLTCCSSY